jgi:hypothetical protein
LHPSCKSLFSAQQHSSFPVPREGSPVTGLYLFT